MAIKEILKQIKWNKLTLVIFSLLGIIFIFKAFLIPVVSSMLGILLSLIDLYKLLEMPYLFFGSALFLFIGWYFFIIFCNISYRLFKFAMTTSIYSKVKGEKNGKEITKSNKH